MANKGTPPQWLADTVIKGFQDMYLGGLRFRPSSPEELMAKADLWINIMWYHNGTAWVKELDNDRLAQAFSRLIASTKDWPTPAEYMQYLPPRPKQQALPSPKASAETVDREMAKMRGLFAGLANSKRMQK